MCKSLELWPRDVPECGKQILMDRSVGNVKNAERNADTNNSAQEISGGESALLEIALQVPCVMLQQSI